MSSTLEKMRAYELEVIEKNLLSSAINDNSDYKNFEYIELTIILNRLKSDHKSIMKATNIIELFVGIIVGFCSGLFLSFPLSLIIFPILGILICCRRHICNVEYERIYNFLNGKCRLCRIGNAVRIEIEGFNAFSMNIQEEANKQYNVK